MDTTSVAIKTISFASPILLIIFIGMLASEILMEMGWIGKLERIGKPLTNLANLPEVCGVTFITAIGSPTAANAMLQDLRENRILTDKETLLASLLNSTVVPIKETLTYHLPVILPTLGLYVGTIYIGTLWLGTIVLLFFVVACGKILLEKRDVSVNLNGGEITFEKSIKKAVKRFARRFGRISLTFLATTFCVFTLMSLGLADRIEEFVTPIARLLNLPPIVFPSIVAYIASPLVGFSMIGSLIHSGVITEKEAVISLLFGSIFMLPILYLRFYFPQWISIFGLRLGILRGLISLSLIMLTRTAVLLIFFVLRNLEKVIFSNKILETMMKKAFVLLLLALAVLGCVQHQEEKKVEQPLKPQMTLVKKIQLENPEPNKIPDVTKERWSFGIPYTKAIVSPDGSRILVVEELKMIMFDSEGNKLWEKPTYGGIDNYIVTEDRVYMTEKYAYKKFKEHGYIICLDMNGDELWRFDMKKLLKSLMEKYMPEDAKISIDCYIKISAYKDELFADAYSTWTVNETHDRAEVLVALNKDGKLLWKVENHGYPGICGLSKMMVINGKLVMGTFSYGDKTNGPAYVHAYGIKTGKELWKFYVPHEDELAYRETTNVDAGVVADKVVAVANFGKIYVLDENGNEMTNFTAFKPIKYGNYTICTNVWVNSVGFGKDCVILAPQKSNVKGVTLYYARAPVKHPDAGSIMVFDLNGNLKWKFRLGGQVTNVITAGKYLILSTEHDMDTLNFNYTGIFIFNLSAKGGAVDKYLGFYHTNGPVLWGSVGCSADGRVIAAPTWPVRAGTKVIGEHALYTLRVT